MATQPNFKSMVSIHTQKRNDLFQKLFEGKTPVDKKNLLQTVLMYRRFFTLIILIRTIT